MDTPTTPTIVEVNGRALRELRDARYWSQAKLADEAGINIATLNRLETGKRDTVYRRTALRLALALGVDLDDILQ